MYYIQKALLTSFILYAIMIPSKKEVTAMRYVKQFNKVRKEWWIFRVTMDGAELTKVFKTEKAADSWIRKNS